MMQQCPASSPVQQQRQSLILNEVNKVEIIHGVSSIFKLLIDFHGFNCCQGYYVRKVSGWFLALLLGYLSIPVVLNLLSSNQAMNTSFDTLRIVNTYGAFGR